MFIVFLLSQSSGCLLLQSLKIKGGVWPPLQRFFWFHVLFALHPSTLTWRPDCPLRDVTSLRCSSMSADRCSTPTNHTLQFFTGDFCVCFTVFLDDESTPSKLVNCQRIDYWYSATWTYVHACCPHGSPMGVNKLNLTKRRPTSQPTPAIHEFFFHQHSTPSDFFSMRTSTLVLLFVTIRSRATHKWVSINIPNHLARSTSFICACLLDCSGGT